MAARYPARAENRHTVVAVAAAEAKFGGTCVTQPMIVRTHDRTTPESAHLILSVGLQRLKLIEELLLKLPGGYLHQDRLTLDVVRVGPRNPRVLQRGEIARAELAELHHRRKVTGWRQAGVDLLLNRAIQVPEYVVVEPLRLVP